MAHPTGSVHPLAKNTTAQWNPSEWASSPNYWSVFEMVKWMTYTQARLDSIEDTSLGLLGDAASSTGGVFARLAALEAGVGRSRTESFTSMPALIPAVLTYPEATANHEYVPSVSGGELKLTMASTATSNNLRTVFGHRASGPMGDSEVRSVIKGTYNASGTLVDPDVPTPVRYQFGHAHRIRRRRHLLLGATPANAVGAGSIDIAGTPWTSGQWVGDQMNAREVWVRIVFGDGTGLHRRVIDNDTNTLFIAPNWTANGGTIPSSIGTGGHVISQFEIYAVEVQAVSVVIGNVAGGGHGMIQPNIWDNGSYKQPGTGQVNINDPSTSSGNYIYPLGSFGSNRAFPWNLKTKCVGNLLSWAVWVQGDPETSYSDTTGRAGSWILEAGDDVGFTDEPGYSGLYIAHLNASESVGWDSMTVTQL